jgi:Domain of unknown function (DUF4365)
MSRREILASALDQDDPARTLRAVVQRFLDAGVSTDDLQVDLTNVRLERRSAGHDVDEDIILDSQDLLSGWCGPGSRLTPVESQPHDFNRRRHSGRAAPTERTGTLGTTEVIAAFERIGWGPVRNDWHDLGIDLFVQARDPRRFDRGLVIAAQVKSGPSAFDEPTIENGATTGWIYRDDANRFDDWVTHGLPHLLVLCNIEARTCYWVHVTRDAVEMTGAGCKITVPSTQQINDENLDALFAVAASQKAHGRLEGSAWDAGPGRVPPARAWRYALIVPRLVAPHPNRIRERSIGPEEAAALVVRGRFYHWDDIAKRQGDVPNRTGALISDDWGWQFAGALASALIDGQPEILYTTVDAAPDNRTRAAAAVAAAVQAAGRDQFGHAIQLLDRANEGDHLEPEDWSWVNLQIARLLVETGDVEVGRKLAIEALQALVGSADDLSASAISAAAAWLLFSTAELLGGDLESTLIAADNAASWWRSQEISSGLTHYFTRAFEAWGGDASLRFETIIETSRGLFAAAAEADLAGDPGAARTTASLLGRYTLMDAQARGDISGVTEALDHLRRVGDDKAVALVSKRLSHAGPLEPLRDVAESLTDESWTRSATKSNFLLWASAGDFMSDERVEAAAAFCFEALTDVDHPLQAQLQLPFILESQAIRTLRSLLARRQRSIHDLASELLVRLAGASGPDALLSQELKVLAHQIDWDIVDPALRERAGSIAETIQGDLADELVRALATEDIQAVIHQAEGGDMTAAAHLADAGTLPAYLAGQVIEKAASVVRSIVESAEGGSHSFGRPVDFGGLLTSLNLGFPQVADWDTVVALLTSAKVLADEKRLALRILAQRANEIPPSMLARLNESYEAIGLAANQITPWEHIHVVEHVRLGQRLGRIDSAEFQRIVLGLVLSEDPRHRSSAATLLSEDSDPNSSRLLIALYADSDMNVAMTGAWAAGRRLRAHPSDEVLATTVLDALKSPGIARILMCLDGLTSESGGRIPAPVLQRLRQLGQQHLSARVRERCAEVLATVE